jgi:hypothetical protein
MVSDRLSDLVSKEKGDTTKNTKKNKTDKEGDFLCLGSFLRDLWWLFFLHGWRRISSGFQDRVLEIVIMLAPVDFDRHLAR